MAAPIYSSENNLIAVPNERKRCTKSCSDIRHSADLRTAFYICQNSLKYKSVSSICDRTKGGFRRLPKEGIVYTNQVTGKNIVASHKVRLHAILQMTETHEGKAILQCEHLPNRASERRRVWCSPNFTPARWWPFRCHQAAPCCLRQRSTQNY